MTVMVMDAQGGGMGRQLVMKIRAQIPDAKVIAVGTNSMATNAMIRAGAKSAATGENAVKVCARRTDVITGPMGILIADAMLGEITSEMARAVGDSPATRVLVPVNSCGTEIAGVGEQNIGQLIDDAVRRIARLAERENR